MPEYFVSLDSSVLIDVLEAMRDGKEVSGWVELKPLIEAKEAILLVPDVTLLEFEKNVTEAEGRIIATRALIENTIKNNVNKKFSDELDQRFSGLFKSWGEEKAKTWREAADGILDVLKVGVPIPFTPEIMCLTRARYISGRFPKPKPRPQKKMEEETAETGPEPSKGDQDCFIIESLIAYFKGDTKDKVLVFATRDADFGPFRDDGSGTLDKIFRDGLPLTQTFKTLPKLVEFVKNRRAVNPLSAEEEAAVDKAKIQEFIAMFVKEYMNRVLHAMEQTKLVLDENLLRQMVIPALRLQGIDIGPQVEAPGADGPFSDTSYVPESPKSPVPDGITVFDASNLGDDPPKPPEVSKSEPKPEDPQKGPEPDAPKK